MVGGVVSTTTIVIVADVVCVGHTRHKTENVTLHDSDMQCVRFSVEPDGDFVPTGIDVESTSGRIWKLDEKALQKAKDHIQNFRRSRVSICLHFWTHTEAGR